jgi:CHASE2 domain-containing sensor protein
VGLSTVGFVHCAIAIAIALATQGSVLICGIVLAIAAYLDVYPILLLLPLLYVSQGARYGSYTGRVRKLLLGRLIMMNGLTNQLLIAFDS